MIYLIYDYGERGFPVVKVTVDGRILYTEKGTLLSEVLMTSGAGADHPCGGKGICKKCLVTVNSKAELSCQYKVTKDIEVTLNDDYIQSFSGAIFENAKSDNMCYVLDLGTTTLALALVSIDNKAITDIKQAVNSQRLYGADVISRIEYCTKNGTAVLQKAVINDVNKLVAEMDVEKALPLYLAGNTAMLHIFFGKDPTSIGVAPYTPQFLEGITVDGCGLGLRGVSIAKALPSIHSFVGADIVAGINLVNDNLNEKYNLLVDLGTNAEIALFSKDKIYCTSAAAGPCFEGASITCGMSASNGAVCEYSEQGYKTVGGASPKGLCGTGLVDIIATLLRKGEIDETGYMNCERRYVAPGIYITRDDVRQYQLAKSAVFSGIITLMKVADICFDEIDRLYISGGFSAKINVTNATQTGLLPEQLGEKAVTLNNSSLLGAVKYACRNDNLSEAVNKAEYIDLSLNEHFSALFVGNMGF